MMGAAMGLFVIDTLLVWSATSTRADLTGGDATAYLRKQLVNVAIGVVLMVMVLATDHRWVRILALAYPVITTLVVVGTANHYLLDAVAGALVVAVGIRLARWWCRRPDKAHRHLPPVPAASALPAQRAAQSSASGSSKPVVGSTVDSSC